MNNSELLQQISINKLPLNQFPNLPKTVELQFQILYLLLSSF